MCGFLFGRAILWCQWQKRLCVLVHTCMNTCPHMVRGNVERRMTPGSKSGMTLPCMWCEVWKCTGCWETGMSCYCFKDISLVAADVVGERAWKWTALPSVLSSLGWPWTSLLKKPLKCLELSKPQHFPSSEWEWCDLSFSHWPCCWRIRDSAC